MARVRLTVDVDPELRRRIKISAAARDETVKDFLERAILNELDNGNSEDDLYVPPKYVKPRGSENPIKPKGGGNPMSDAVIEDREFYPSEGGKPRGSKNPPKPRSGRTVADAVIEDRR